MSTEPLSAWRYRLTVEQAPKRTHRTMNEGRALRACREACELGRDEVARGWGIESATLGAIESGNLRFPTVFDLQAAISQLWCWRSERGRRG